MSASRDTVGLGPELEAGMEQRVRAEQVRLLYSQLPVSVTGTMVAVLFLCVLMWDAVSHAVLIAWAAVMAANQSWRLAFYIRFRREGLDDARAPAWSRYWAGGAAASGLIWGAASVLLFVPDSLFHQTVLIVTLFAITAVGVPMISSHAPSFYLFTLPALLPIVVKNTLEGGREHLIIAFVTFCVMLGVISVGRNYHRLLRTSLRNRFSTEALAARLSSQNTELEQARRVAEEASRAKTQFFAAASHDLRQPLHAVGLFASALAQRAHEPEVLKLVGSINASVHALEGLFNELLDISKIDAGVIRPEPRPFPAAELFDRLRTDFEPVAQERGLRLSLARTRLWAHSDPLLVERVLRNLVSNAIRYTERGGILVACRPRGAALRFEVRDSGIGIPTDKQQRVFEEFFQIGNPQRTSKMGLGLGLSIVKRLCALLGSEIRLASEPGRGTRFWFDLPRTAAAAPVASPRPPRPPAAERLAGRLLVVIDDEEAILEGMRALLAAWGAEVLTSADGSEVVDALYARERLPDLLIADYRLANEITGLDVIRRLRQVLDPEIPAILVTGSTTPETVAQAEVEGVAMMLKPLDPERLRQAVEAQLYPRAAREGVTEATGPGPSR
ncbi:MAG TPA: ATP-binding protein [Burkholderiales bacterium]|nr:ATP-binding protein [Burkholderiales bacterium]